MFSFYILENLRYAQDNRDEPDIQKHNGRKKRLIRCVRDETRETESAKK